MKGAFHSLVLALGLLCACVPRETTVTAWEWIRIDVAAPICVPAGVRVTWQHTRNPTDGDSIKVAQHQWAYASCAWTIWLDTREGQIEGQIYPAAPVMPGADGNGGLYPPVDTTRP